MRHSEEVELTPRLLDTEIILRVTVLPPNKPSRVTKKQDTLPIAGQRPAASLALPLPFHEREGSLNVSPGGGGSRARFWPELIFRTTVTCSNWRSVPAKRSVPDGSRYGPDPICQGCEAKTTARAKPQCRFSRDESNINRATSSLIATGYISVG